MVDAIEGANTPRTNLSESKHGSWLAGEGGRTKISLYDACVSDLANALLQSAKQQAYLQGRHLGEGPSLQSLINRSALRATQAPRTVATAVNNVVTGTPMHFLKTSLSGDRETVQRKRGPVEVVNVEDNATHRPEYIHVNMDRTTRGRRKKLDFQNANVNETIEEVCLVVEREIHDTQWAIRRTEVGSKVKCLGWIPKKGMCGRIVSNAQGNPAPCFFGSRKHPGGDCRQFMWFCPDECRHTWDPSRCISKRPSNIPSIWPVATGTNLSLSEIEALNRAG